MAAHEYEAVRVHVLKGDRILLGLHRSRSVWTTFGGQVEPGETVEQTLRRELDEELGISPTRVWRLADRTSDWDGVPALVAVFAVTSWQGAEANLAHHEHDTIAWFSAAEVAGLPMAEAGRREALTLLAASKR